MLQTAPVQPAEREKIMDILRGFALLGIFIANLSFLSLLNNQNNSTGFFYPLDKTVKFFETILVEGKFYSIFSFLFGWGIALQMQRLADKGINPVPFIRRRLGIMLLLGIFHLIILWPGDIVAFYAMLGFLLLLFRNKPDKSLLWWSIGLILSPILIYFLKMHFLWLNAPAGLLFQAGGWIDIHLNNMGPDDGGPSPARTSTWIEIWKLNIGGSLFRFAYLFFVSRISKVLGVFLLGYLIGRNYNYRKILGNRTLLQKLALGGFLLGLPANYLMAHFGSNEGDYFNLKINGWYQTVFYALGVVPLAIAYMSSIALMYQSSFGKKIFSLLQPVGKMAFSNYMWQSLISIIVFYGVGLGKGGQLGHTALLLFAIGIFIGQIIFSYIWLQIFRFGPVEWIWRSATYKKWQPMMKYKVKNTER